MSLKESLHAGENRNNPQEPYIRTRDDESQECSDDTHRQQDRYARVLTDDDILGLKFWICEESNEYKNIVQIGRDEEKNGHAK
jgi:hypothetical protein